MWALSNQVKMSSAEVEEIVTKRMPWVHDIELEEFDDQGLPSSNDPDHLHMVLKKGLDYDIYCCNGIAHVHLPGQIWDGNLLQPQDLKCKADDSDSECKEDTQGEEKEDEYNETNPMLTKSKNLNIRSPWWSDYCNGTIVNICKIHCRMFGPNISFSEMTASRPSARWRFCTTMGIKIFYGN
ncbi:hypothetical protein BT96DRAFT_940192 [Gymnopus androsaceus JB14]|uniref:Uncharacterized protein n=1 Tax=Gymnopus androsaceus JB14 TaxID=1447944 RepID=A0A6A4HK12_9AGAR|nr:hypothetical protein BT96DRAFT_940192 [Gymnopus androsaceus JB14]